MKTKYPSSLVTQIAFGSAILILLVVGALSYRTIAESSESDRWVRHSHEVMENLEGMLLAVVSLESSYRGFVLTGEESLLESYRSSKLSAEQRKAALRNLMADSPEQARQLSVVGKLAEQKFQFAEMVSDQRRIGGVETAMDAIRSDRGVHIMDAFQAALGKLRDNELLLLAQRDTDARARVARVKLVLIAGTILGLLITAAAGWNVHRDNARRSLAEAALRDSEEQYRMVLYEVQDYAIYMLDSRGHVVTWNAGAERIKGYNAEKIINRSFSCFFPPEEVKQGRPEKILRLTAASGRHEEQCMRVRRSGSQFVASVTCTALRDSTGKLRGFSEICRDLSETQELGVKYRGLLEAAPDAMVVVNQNGDIVLLNVRAEKEFGYRRDELLGQKVKSIIPEGFAERLTADGLRSTEDALAQQIGAGIELLGLRKDGSEFPIEIMLSPLNSAEGTLVTAAIRDISVRKSKQEKLDQLVHVLDRAPAIVRKFDGEILHWGQGLHVLYGWTVGEALGRSSHELLATTFPRPLPDILAELLDTGVWQGELVRTHRDGHRVTVASRWELYQENKDDPVSVLEFDSDITETRKAQSMLKEREARLRSILETAPDALITIDENGVIQSFSSAAEKLFGYSSGEVNGRNVKLLIPEPHHESRDGHLTRYLQTGEKSIVGVSRQVKARHKDGSIFPADLAVGEVTFDGTQIFTAFMRDLTARVKMEQDLLQVQKMEAIGQLTGGVAHDFNNLLTVISGNLEMLERRLPDAESHEILKEAQEASKLGAGLSKRLLAFGRRQPLNPKPTDLNVLVGATVELLRRSLGETTEIETHLFEGLPRIMVDPGQIENALLNLAINARDAMPDGGQLIIQTAMAEIDSDYAAAFADVLPGKFVTLSVTDTGAGMTPEVQQRAFEPFYTTKGPGEGSGLGLSMIYGFVKQSGGHVWLYSEPGIGTTVRIYLPEHAGEASDGREPVPAPNVRETLGETVLVVEDDQRVRRVSGIPAPAAAWH